MIDRIIARLKRAWHIKILRKDPIEWQIAQWRKAGIKIGENCKIYSMLPTGRDSFLISIGDNVTFSGHVDLVCHDNAIIKPSRGKYTDVFGRITIGNNCFIGLGSIILGGSSWQMIRSSARGVL